MRYVPSVEHHHRVVATLRLIRLQGEVQAEEDRLRASLTEEQRAGRACAVCGRADRATRPVTELDGVALVECAGHGGAVGGGSAALSPAPFSLAAVMLLVGP